MLAKEPCLQQLFQATVSLIEKLMAPSRSGPGILARRCSQRASCHGPSCSIGTICGTRGVIVIGQECRLGFSGADLIDRTLLLAPAAGWLKRRLALSSQYQAL